MPAGGVALQHVRQHAAHAGVHLGQGGRQQAPRPTRGAAQLAAAAVRQQAGVVEQGLAIQEELRQHAPQREDVLHEAGGWHEGGVGTGMSGQDTEARTACVGG